MKRIKILIFLLVLLFSTSLYSCYKAPEHDIVVYKTEAGQKYHEENCRYVRNKAIAINLSRALYDGLDPCKVCHPKTQKDLDTLNKD